jgi:hypothetical protein
VLVCTGPADPWSNHAVTAEIVGCLQRPEVLLLDGAGHLPNLEAETEFNDALRAFLRAHAPGSGAGPARPGSSGDTQGHSWSLPSQSVTGSEPGGRGRH